MYLMAGRIDVVGWAVFGVAGGERDYRAGDSAPQSSLRRARMLAAIGRARACTFGDDLRATLRRERAATGRGRAQGYRM
jgi:hypothetical protein